ncbi:MAG: hypothetical protein K0U98_17710 [Deltaproteobacteria bacterium]|nr:hypothetical protein [Deltaproteobacteria bacterium]
MTLALSSVAFCCLAGLALFGTGCTGQAEGQLAKLPSIGGGGGSGAGSEGSADEGLEESTGKGEAVEFEASWKEVDRLISEQKFEAAAEVAQQLLVAAQEAGDEEEWTRALIKVVNLRTALHGYETAVRFLAEQPWPESAVYQTALRLYYARSLVTYQQSYSWEIGQRERVDTGEVVDLKAWTRDQIAEEAVKAYGEIWQRREEWGSESLGVLGEYINQNDYPARIRGTLRDAVSYLWVELLSNSSLWRPTHSNQLYLLDFEALVAGTSEEIDLTDPAVHPLAKVGSILGDLEGWHRAGNRPEAAFEARRQRLIRLQSSFSRSEEKAALRKELEKSLADLGRHHPWWSMGMSTLVEMVQGKEAGDALVEARRLALEGEEAHPESIGGQRCRSLAAAIEVPFYKLTSMSSDGPGRRSIQVDHKNLSRLYFRAYHLDLLEQIRSARDSNLLPSHQKIDALLAGNEASTAWSIDLPPTLDYRQHQTFVSPPAELWKMGRPGLYVVVASAREDFAEGANRRAAVNLVVTRLVILSSDDDQGYEVTVVDGGSGDPVAGAEVLLYRADWRKGHSVLNRQRSTPDGRVRFPLKGRQRQAHFFVATHGDDVVVDANYKHFRQQGHPGEATAALLYTDRSAYRPQQKILWKAVAYRGRGADGRFATLADTSLTVHLMDSQGQEVESHTVSTNDFGTASGEFEIPTGRLLGAWSMRTSLGGSTSIRVEEYKRPTFEVTVNESKENLRLNHAATLKGEARYYFGLPVSSGQVVWRVSREPIYRWGWWWGARRSTEIIAGGEVSLGEDGGFEITFIPEADDREEGVTYRYRLDADVTDDGGETRSASRAFRLGRVAVEATISKTETFLLAGEAGEVSILRSDLDGNPRAGSGQWRLIHLQQPETTETPGDLLVHQPPEKEGEEIFRTPGDSLRPRWNAQYDPHRELSRWLDGNEQAQGEIEHDESGRATLDLPSLEAGAYRLRYTTEDAFGGVFETKAELIVAAPGATPLALPGLLLVEKSSVAVGETARLLVHSGLAQQTMVLETFRAGRRQERRFLSSQEGLQLIEFPITREDRGGFGVTLTAVRDYQLIGFTGQVFVPWDDRKLKIEFATFRDRLRPGSGETWKVQVKSADGESVSQGAAEILAYMYDRSLDVFAPHQPMDPLSLYPSLTRANWVSSSLAPSFEVWQRSTGFGYVPRPRRLSADSLKFYDGYGIGGLGRRSNFANRRLRGQVAAPMASMAMDSSALEESSEQVSSVPGRQEVPKPKSKSVKQDELAPASPEGDAVRSDFSETAFWHPHLLTEEDGSVSFEFQIPDSVTEWNVWVLGVTRDLRGGSLQERTKTVKELLVRPYLPRFLREGDKAELKVVVNNAGEEDFSGHLDFAIQDPVTGESLASAFGLSPQKAKGVSFAVKAGGSADLTFPILVPSRVGTVAFKVLGRAGSFSDGELRPLPVLPGRLHLLQSRFAALREGETRQLHFADLAANDDPTRIDDQMVVTLDVQLFYSVLNALPYLVNFPYECTEQTLNRFLSTGIVSSLYRQYPAVAEMAKELSARETRLERWDDADANRKMALEETPWLMEARGGAEPADKLANVLDPRIAEAERRSSLAKLEKAQTSLGAFPWWPGGPPSPYMTLYLLQGFSRALEFGVEVPQPMVQQAWAYLHRHYVDTVARSMVDQDCCWEFVTFLGYVLSSYPDESWTGGVFTADDRQRMLSFSFRHWKRHSPLLKAYLALTLHRADRPADARLVFDSIMDSAKTTQDEGTFWAPEDRSWLWYNDTTETHAFALRALSELDPLDDRRHGLVHWLLLNKKLNHWQSTRATAEVLHSLVYYLDREGALGVREQATVAVGPRTETLVFEPNAYTGDNNQIVVAGADLDPETMATVEVSKEGKGLMFASATWHFSTERLPEESRGDFLQVTRRFYKRQRSGDQWTLRPLEEGAPLTPGDQVEVHLSLRSKHALEYVHLRDPRGAGFEPESVASSYKWNLGIGWYEEIRDSGTNFFFDSLPVGEFTFKYRLRASLAGSFRVGPATVQPMYAPEFAAYSSGAMLKIVGE